RRCGNCGKRSALSKQLVEIIKKKLPKASLSISTAVAVSTALSARRLFQQNSSPRNGEAPGCSLGPKTRVINPRSKEKSMATGSKKSVTQSSSVPELVQSEVDQ